MPLGARLWHYAPELLGKAPPKVNVTLFLVDKIHLPAYSETMVPIKVHAPFQVGLIEGITALPSSVHVCN